MGKQKPVLLLGNKQDLTNASTMRELFWYLDLEAIKGDQAKLVKLCLTSSSYNKLDKGLKEGLKWLVKSVQLDWANLSRLVDEDTVKYRLEAKNKRDIKRKKIEQQRAGGD